VQDVELLRGIADGNDSAFAIPGLGRARHLGCHQVGRGADQRPAARGGSSAEVFPDRYKLLAVQAWVSEKISIGTLAKLLRCTLTEAREFAYQQAEISTDTDGVEERFSVNLNDSLLTTR
jgi:hypothetical protein